MASPLLSSLGGEPFGTIAQDGSIGSRQELSGADLLQDINSGAASL
jgi:hypothetical protein